MAARRARIGRPILLALVAVVLAFLAFPCEPRITREGPTVDFVEQAVAVSAATVHERLASGLEHELQSHPDFGGFGLRVVGIGRHDFPLPHQMQYYASENAGLSRYVRLGKASWMKDFFVHSPYKNWFSEYLKNGKPVNFRTDFLIHLEPVEAQKTRIEVIEYAPKVIVGTEVRLCGRHLVPSVSPDARPVAPTTEDRREMLDIVLRVAQREFPTPDGGPSL